MRIAIVWSVRVCLVALVCCVSAGCGVVSLQRNLFPNAATSDDGRGLTLEAINEIVDDPDLTEDEKRQALREDLGIEDEDLIDALLS